MSILLDSRYISLVANRLDRFKRKNQYLYNFRCNICGDSEEKKSKARAYFYKKEQHMLMVCHNCGASMMFSRWLSGFDQFLHGEYLRESYAERQEMGFRWVAAEAEAQVKTPVVQAVDGLFRPVAELPEHHLARRYLRDRKIPEAALKSMFYVNRTEDLNLIQGSEVFTGKDPRILLPYYDRNNVMTAFTARSIRPSTKKYIAGVIHRDRPQVFGIDSVDTTKPVMVTEGPIDSLFLDNAVAVAGTNLGKIREAGLSPESSVMVVDNQPRNPEVCQAIEKLIRQNYNVVIWPKKIDQKDINDMIMSGMTTEDVTQVISENTYQGMEARLRFVDWKRC